MEDNTRTLIFDCDGVLLDTTDYHLNLCLQVAPSTFSREEFLAHHEGNFYRTPSGKNIFEGVDWDKYDELMDGSYATITMSHDVLYALEMLKREQNCRMAIVSSGHEELIRQNLAFNKVSDCFDFIFGKQTSFSKVDKLQMTLDTYNISASDTLFITDTLGDIREANEVGVKSIGVLGGYHSEETLRKGNPLEIIRSLPELITYL